MSHCQNENLKSLLFLKKFRFEEMEEEIGLFFSCYHHNVLFQLRKKYFVGFF